MSSAKQPASARPRIGVVVVHYGDPAPTRAALAALCEDPSPVDRTLVVVNAGGLDPETEQRADHVVHSLDNPGYGEAANRGVAWLCQDSAAGELSTLVVLNHDARVAGGFLAAAEAACRGKVGAAGGPIRWPDGRLWYAGGGLRWWSGTVTQSRDEPAATVARDVAFIPATALAIQPAAWAAIGGFDPWYFLYNEDVDLCLRLRARGWRLRFEPGLAAIHDLGGATGSSEHSALYLEHLARGRLRPYSPWLYRLYLGVLHTGWNLLRAGLLMKRHGRAALPRVRALARGHCAALATILRRPGAAPADSPSRGGKSA